MIRSYLSVTKPGIIFGNAITALAGFALAGASFSDIRLGAFMLLGLSLIVACGCVANNYLDRAMDGKMDRTKARVLVTQELASKRAIGFSIALGLLGSLILGFFTNALTLLSALFGLFFYVVVYGSLKYKTAYGTLIGSVAGAIPPLVGYFAWRPLVDGGAILLFFIVALWQMPHFYAIAIYRLSEYAKASIPVWPLVHGVASTKVHIAFYAIAFVIASLLPAYMGLVGSLFTAVVGLMGIAWVLLCLMGFKSKDDKLWARECFLFSLLMITTLSSMIVIDRL